jgi:hypothetical protein
MHAYPASAIAVALLLAPACGGTDDTERPTRSAGIGEDSPNLYSCEDAVELFEFRTLEPFDEDDVADDANRTLGWWVSYDGSNDVDVEKEQDGVPIYQTQSYNFSPAPPSETNQTRTTVDTTEDGAPTLEEGGSQCDDSPRAMRVVSGEPGFSGWGYALGSNINWSGPADEDPHDASDWEGLAFWGRLGKTGRPATLSATVIDQYTSASEGTYCSDGLYVDQSCDTFGRGVGLDEEWRLVLIPFEKMYQEGFGLAAPEPMPEIDQLAGISFYFGKGSWEIWLDEVSYYRSKED